MAGDPEFKGTPEDFLVSLGYVRHDVAQRGPYVLSFREGMTSFTVRDKRPGSSAHGNILPGEFKPGFDVYDRDLRRRNFPTPEAAFEFWVAEFGE